MYTMKYIRLLLFIPFFSNAKLTHIWFDTWSVVQDYVNYAFSISSGDMDFVLTLQGENPSRDPNKVSKFEPSHWFCQMHMRWQSKTIKDPRFKDPYRQLDQCWYKYRTGTPMYAYNTRLSHSHLFVHVPTQTKRTSNTNTFGDRVRTYVFRPMDDLINKGPRVAISNLEIHRHKWQTWDSK